MAKRAWDNRKSGRSIFGLGRSIKAGIQRTAIIGSFGEVGAAKGAAGITLGTRGIRMEDKESKSNAQERERYVTA